MDRGLRKASENKSITAQWRKYIILLRHNRSDMECDDVMEGRHRNVQDLSDAQTVRHVCLLTHGSG